MRRSWIILGLLCLVLSGCTLQTQKEQTASLPQRLSPTKETENDTLKCYPLDGTECRFFADGQNLYLTFGQTPYLLRLEGKSLVQTAAFPLPSPSCQIRVDNGCPICYDPERGVVQLLSRELTPIQTILLPEPVAHTPVLCAQGNHLYYGTESKLVVVDLDTGLHRTLRAGDSLEIIGILESQNLLLCRREDKTYYISALDGSLVDTSPLVTQAAHIGNRDCFCVKCGENDCLYLTDTMLPLVPGTKFLTFLPQSNAVLAFQNQDDPVLILYDLTTGNQLARTAAPFSTLPQQACATDDGRIFFFQPDESGHGYLFQWQPVQEHARELNNRITAPYTSQDPDTKGLAQCYQQAGFLEQQFGMQILLNTQATQILPRGCTAEPEHLTAFLLDTLERVNRSLLKLPGQLVRSAFQDTGKTYLGIVRSLTLEGQAVDHLQFWIGTDSYILLTASDNVEEAVLRCLSPMIDARILTLSNAYDLWDDLNPSGFSYGALCQGLSGFAQEAGGLSVTRDREELFLAALSQGNRERFCDALLQKKLRQLCLGIRQAFPTLGKNNALTWEQYLWEPL